MKTKLSFLIVAISVCMSALAVEVPAKLFVRGTALAESSVAMEMKRINEDFPKFYMGEGSISNTYELFTALKTGSYEFATSADGGALIQAATITVDGGESLVPYRIRVNFDEATPVVSVLKVDEVILWAPSKKYVIIESPSKKLMYGTKRAARGDIMVKKEMIAMLLAGGQGSRLGVLTQKVAKPAVSFGGKYRIIDFPLSNCINSGVDTVGVLTQYQPLRLNAHIGIGIPWDLDRNVGGVTILPPYERSKGSDWYTGTANAIYQNLEYMESYNPEYVLILSGDHIYKMDYEVMLEYHKANNADVTIAAMPVPIEEASRFGILITDDNNKITEFEEKPANPRSNLASMGIYIFSWKALKEALIKLSEEPGCDFGKHVIPYCFEQGKRIFAYEYNGYWKDVGTLGSYWEANMELIDIIPEFNLYEEYWKIYTKSDRIPPQYISADAKITKCIIGEGSEIYGEVTNSVIGSGVTIEKGAVVKDSIIMQDSVIGEGAVVEKAIVAEDVKVGAGAHLGVGEYAPSKYDQKVYQFDLVTIGEHSVIPENIKIGKNTAISGVTTAEDYPDGALESGGYIVKAGGIV